MTVSTATSFNSYAGNGSTTSFAYAFKIFQDSNLVVTLVNDTTGVETTQTLTTDYTVTGAGSDSGGSVVFGTAPALGNTVVIRRVLPVTQETNYVPNDPFPAEAHEDALDKLTMLVQQEVASSELAVQFPEGDVGSGINNILPSVTGRADKLIKFGLDGAVEVIAASDLSNAIIGANYSVDTFTGTGSTTVYTLSSEPGSKANTAIYIDGVYQAKANYSVSGSTLTFTTAPPLNSAIEIVIGDAIPAGAATTASAVSYTQGGTGAVTTNVQAKLRETVSVKDFGAVGDGVADDTAAIQAALDFTRTSGVTVPKKVLIPSGEYKITSTLDVPGLTSLVGVGQSSILRCYSCNGLNMESSNGIGPLEISNFWLYANGGENFTAIVTDLNSTSSGPRLQGRIYKNLYMSFWGLGMYQRGAWHTTYQSIRMNQCYNGIEIQDQNVKLFFNDIVITRGTITGTGTTIGFHVGSTGGPSSTRPEDVFIQNSLIYGYEQGIYWRQCLFGGVLRCDLDACVTEGIRVVTADGGFIIRDNWIQVIDDGGTYYGIILQNLGYTPEDYNISIENNKIGLTSTTPALAWAIYLGSAHRGVSCRDNSIQGDWQIGIRADASVHCRVAGNNVSSTTGYGIDLRNTTDTVLSENYSEDGITLLNNTRLKTGPNSGLHNTSFAGDISVPSGTTTATVTFSSLSLPDLPNGTYSSFVFFNNPSSTTRNEVWGTVSATGITYYLETSFGITANIQFRVEVG